MAIKLSLSKLLGVTALAGLFLWVALVALAWAVARIATGELDPAPQAPPRGSRSRGELFELPPITPRVSLEDVDAGVAERLRTELLPLQRDRFLSLDHAEWWLLGQRLLEGTPASDETLARIQDEVRAARQAYERGWNWIRDVLMIATRGGIDAHDEAGTAAVDAQVTALRTQVETVEEPGPPALSEGGQPPALSEGGQSW